MISVTIRSDSTAPAATFAQVLLHDAVYGCDCTGSGRYLKTKAIRSRSTFSNVQVGETLYWTLETELPERKLAMFLR